MKNENALIKKDTFANALLIQTAFIGDVVLTTVLIRLFKQKFPNVKLSLLVRADIGPLVADLPEIEQVYTIYKGHSFKSILNMIALIRKIRHQRFDLLLCPHKSLRSAILALCSRIPLRCGFENASFLANLAYHRRAPYQKQPFEALRYLQFLASTLQFELGSVKTEQLIPHLPYLEFQKSHNPSTNLPKFTTHSYIHQLLLQLSARRTIAIAPSSVWATKRWPTWNFALLCRQIVEHHKKEIIFIGSAKDINIVAKICQTIRLLFPEAMHYITNSCGKIKLNQLGLVLQKCDFLITNDSAPGHIGCAANIPVLSLFGATHPSQGFAPVGTSTSICQINLECRPCGRHGHRQCPKKHFRCMKELDAMQVFIEIKKILRKIQ